MEIEQKCFVFLKEEQKCSDSLVNIGNPAYQIIKLVDFAFTSKLSDITCTCLTFY